MAVLARSTLPKPEQRRTRLVELLSEKPFSLGAALEERIRQAVSSATLAVVSSKDIAADISGGLSNLPVAIEEAKDAVYSGIEETIGALDNSIRRRLAASLEQIFSKELLSASTGSGSLADLFIAQSHTRMLAEVLVAEIFHDLSGDKQTAKNGFDSVTGKSMDGTLRELGVNGVFLSEISAQLQVALSFTELLGDCTAIVTAMVERVDTLFQNSLQAAIYEAAKPPFPDLQMRGMFAGRIKNIALEQLQAQIASFSRVVFQEIRRELPNGDRPSQPGAGTTLATPASLTEAQTTTEVFTHHFDLSASGHPILTNGPGARSPSAPKTAPAAHLSSTVSGSGTPPLGVDIQALAASDEDLYGPRSSAPAAPPVPDGKRLYAESDQHIIETAVSEFRLSSVRTLSPITARTDRSIAQTLDTALRRAITSAAHAIARAGISISYDKFYDAVYTCLYIEVPGKQHGRKETINVINHVNGHCYPDVTQIKEFMRTEITNILQGGHIPK